MKRLEGQRVIVTGAAQGLGEALALRFAQAGCDVCGWDVNGGKIAESMARTAAASGQRTHGLAADVTDESAVNAAMEASVAFLGGLDVVVCNAAILFSGDSLTLEAAAWRKVLDVNLTGYFLTARAAARVMVPQRRGVILNINSKSGKKGSAKNAAYAASKFGGIGLTQSLALEFAAAGVRVNAICPGNLLDSPLWKDSLFKQYAANQGITEEQVREKYLAQVPLGRSCTYDDICGVAVFLASDDASYMTGQAINVTGGQQMD